MAVVGKVRKGGKKTFYVTVNWGGAKLWERAGFDKRQAERLNRQRQKEIKDGTYSPRHRSGRILLADFAESWLAKRTARWADGERYLRTYVLSRDWLAGMRLEDVRKLHGKQLAEELKATVSAATGKPLSEKTCANIVGVARTMMQAAVDEELIAINPFALPRGTFERAPRARRKPYDVEAIRKLLASPDVTPSAKVFAVIAFYTGMREGELCGRRWRDVDWSTKPLGCLTVADQYEGRPLKTERRAGTRSRLVPIHPELERILRWWWTEGWQLVHLREPQPDDFIVPAKGAGAHTKSSAYKLWRKACTAAGVTNLSLHSTRHTFLSLARRGGARKEVIERVTHNASGDIVDSYTHWDWAPLCEAVACIRIGEALVTPVLPSHTSAAENVVEAPGIESGRPGGTDGKHEELEGTAPQDDPPESPGKLAIVDTEGAARQQCVRLRWWEPGADQAYCDEECDICRPWRRALEPQGSDLAPAHRENKGDGRNHTGHETDQDRLGRVEAGRSSDSEDDRGGTPDVTRGAQHRELAGPTLARGPLAGGGSEEPALSRLDPRFAYRPNLPKPCGCEGGLIEHQLGCNPRAPWVREAVEHLSVLLGGAS